MAYHPPPPPDENDGCTIGKNDEERSENKGRGRPFGPWMDYYQSIEGVTLQQYQQFSQYKKNSIRCEWQKKYADILPKKSFQ